MNLCVGSWKDQIRKIKKDVELELEQEVEGTSLLPYVFWGCPRSVSFSEWIGKYYIYYSSVTQVISTHHITIAARKMDES